LRFLLVGGGAAMLDLCLYLLLKVVGLPVWLAKAASFVTASVAAYAGNKHYTFQRGVRSSGSLLIYAALYGSTLALNVAVNSLLLALLSWPRESETFAAWLLATAASATVNFVGTKYLVFRGDRLR
jgi:putative flippase GtrA